MPLQGLWVVSFIRSPGEGAAYTNIEQIPIPPGICRQNIHFSNETFALPPSIAANNSHFPKTVTSTPTFLFTYIRELPNINAIFSPFALIPATSSHFLLEANKFFFCSLLFFFFSLFFHIFLGCFFSQSSFFSSPSPPLSLSLRGQRNSIFVRTQFSSPRSKKQTRCGPIYFSPKEQRFEIFSIT